ncbi:MAG: Fe2+-dependent dioxygenase [Leptolyngbya sp. SIO4C1]|nr:Fe2+-dependent dioxygenase [Leptolyngbya sp. SIO4C1]
MLFRIPALLSAQTCAEMVAQLEAASFVEGKTTAGWYAKQVKHNQQLAPAEAAPLRQQIVEALNRHPLFQAAVRPKRIHTVLLSRYDPGMAYGTHADNALMGQWRSDISFTVFLSSPQTYAGGELVIEGADDEQTYKLAAGSVLVYPASALHRVNEVTQGVRLVAVGWVQSWIRDPAQRELLFDLDTARRSLFAKQGKTDEFDLISKSVANLLRRWVD